VFKAKDKNGQEIFLKDRVGYTGVVEGELMGDEVSLEGIIILIPSETQVEVQPLGGGLPFLMPSEEVHVKDSLVHRVANIATIEQFQALIFDTEKRYQDEVASGKKPRKGGGGGKAAAKKVSNPFA